MKKLIEKYESQIGKCKLSIDHMFAMIDAGNNGDETIDIDDLLEEIQMAKHQSRMYAKFIKDIKECDLVKACTELSEEDSFAHVKDVPTMLSKAGNMLEIKANNEGNTSVIAKALQNIANNINKAIC